MIEDLMSQYEAGGFFMHTILFCSAIGLAIVIERLTVLLAASKIDKETYLNGVNQYILKGQLSKAISLSAQTRSPLTNIVRAGLKAIANNGGPEEVQTAMDAVALKEVPSLERRIGLLATVSNIATLLGLLGTVSGLIGAFGAVANVAPAEKATMLANAIATAMNTTAFGLLVAIPLLGAFGFLNSYAQRLIDDLHEASVATLNFILANKDKIQIDG